MVDNATMNGWGGVCKKLRGESSRRLESLACRPSIAAGFPTVRLASSPQDSDLIDDDGITATPCFRLTYFSPNPLYSLFAPNDRRLETSGPFPKR
jgi:hypothetical protein